MPLTPTTINGLSKESGVDTFQTKSLSLDRFEKKIGVVKAVEIKDIVEAIALCIGV